MRMRFTKDTGDYKAGETYNFHPDVAAIYVKEGVAKEVKPKRNKAVQKKNVKTKAVANGQ